MNMEKMKKVKSKETKAKTKTKNGFRNPAGNIGRGFYYLFQIELFTNLAHFIKKGVFLIKEMHPFVE